MEARQNHQKGPVASEVVLQLESAAQEVGHQLESVVQEVALEHEL